MSSILWVGRDGIARLTPRRPVNLNDLIACPTCFAAVDECCRTPSGNKVLPHKGRLAPRLCPCGRVPHPGFRYCRRCQPIMAKRRRELARARRIARAAA